MPYQKLQKGMSYQILQKECHTKYYKKNVIPNTKKILKKECHTKSYKKECHTKYYKKECHTKYYIKGMPYQKLQEGKPYQNLQKYAIPKTIQLILWRDNSLFYQHSSMHFGREPLVFTHMLI